MGQVIESQRKVCQEEESLPGLRLGPLNCGLKRPVTPEEWRCQWNSGKETDRSNFGRRGHSSHTQWDERLDYYSTDKITRKDAHTMKTGSIWQGRF